MAEQSSHGIVPESSAGSSPALGTSIEFLQHCQQEISEEDSLKGILKRFVGVLTEHFGLTHASYFLAQDTTDESEPKRGTVRFPPAKVIEEEFVPKLRTLLNSVLDQDSESRQGFCTVKFQGADYFFVVFTDAVGKDGYFVWRQPMLTPKTPLLRQLKDHPTSAHPILDFIARSMQQASNWLRRLDKTQALLYQDEVTGLYNYRYLDVAIDSELKRLHRFHAPFSLLFIDLDNFKAINDEHGHMTGSNVLRQVGEVIKLAVRDVDNVIRYGGDEFVVVLIGANSRQAQQAAERVRSRVQAANFKSEEQKSLKLTVSIGVASCPEHGRDRKTILKMADETMYASKKSGKNRVMVVSSTTHADSTSTTQVTE